MRQGGKEEAGTFCGREEEPTVLAEAEGWACGWGHRQAWSSDLVPEPSRASGVSGGHLASVIPLYLQKPLENSDNTALPIQLK